MQLPSREDIADRRIGRFKDLITETLEAQDLDFFEELVDAYQSEHDVGLSEIAAALAYLLQRERPLVVEAGAAPKSPRRRRPPTGAGPAGRSRPGSRRASAGRSRTCRWSATGSRSAASTACSPRTSSGRSPTRPASRAATSAASRSTTPTPSSTCPRGCQGRLQASAERLGLRPQAGYQESLVTSWEICILLSERLPDSPPCSGSVLLFSSSRPSACSAVRLCRHRVGPRRQLGHARLGAEHPGRARRPRGLQVEAGDGRAARWRPARDSGSGARSGAGGAEAAAG